MRFPTELVLLVMRLPRGRPPLLLEVEGGAAGPVGRQEGLRGSVLVIRSILHQGQSWGMGQAFITLDKER